MSGNKSTVQSPAYLEKKLFADTYLSIASKSVRLGQIINLRGHTSNGIGGGNFVVVSSSGLTADNGSISVTGSAGLYAVRQNAKRTPYEFGFLDGGVDASVAINACSSAYGECFLDKGKTYNIQYTVNPLKLVCSGGVAKLNCVSPTANNRFGSLSAAVYQTGGVGSPLEGVDVRNIFVECNQLIGVTGSTGLKGFYFQRLKNFYQSGCTVSKCASYGYWDSDVSGTGTTYCYGVRENCWAIDCAVSYEQVNVRGITLNNCHAYTSTDSLTFVPECQYHAYGGSDMRVVYNNCTGIADGVCPAIVSLALECKNFAANDCRFINNHNGGADIRAAVYMESSGGNFDNIKFKNCELKSLYYGACILNIGASGNSNAIIKADNCRITGKDFAVTISGSGGIFEFTNCDALATASGGTTPWSYYNNGSPTRFKVVGGSAVVSGGVLPSYPSNFGSDKFIGVYASPSVSALPIIRQEVIGAGVLLNGGDNANYTASFPAAIVDWGKVVVDAVIDSTGMSSANSAAAAVGFSANNITTTQVRLYTAQAQNGKTVKYCLREYY